MAETILNAKPIIVALLGGLLPSLVWLWFWMRQDQQNPEPRGLIAISFFAGMAIVYFVLPFQKLIVTLLSPLTDLAQVIAGVLSLTPPDEQTVKITLWAFIEELAKYLTVLFIAFKSKYFDEPKDALIYLITAALGFAAMENALYIFKDLANGGIMDMIGNGHMRFIGATTVHIVSSAFIGIAVAFAFNAPRFIKIFSAMTGIVIATLLHAYFNLSIIPSDTTLKTLLTFIPFWAAIVGIIILLALIKRFTKTNRIY